MVVDDDKPRNKVQAIVEKRDLEGIVLELEQRWNGDGFESHSVRELTSVFNQQIVRDAITDAGEIPLDGEVENFYRLLTDGDVRSGSVIQARNRLSEYGINPDELEDDLISHQTMYRYLKHVREIDTSPDRKSIDELMSTVRDSVRRLNSRTQSVVQQNLEQLNKREEFAVGDFDIIVTVQFSCSDCGKTGEVSKIIDEYGCDCTAENEQ